LDNQLTTTCGEILDQLGIEPFTDRALTWVLPTELIEEHMATAEAPLQMFGYQVHMEVLQGETTITLVETL
jgi:hypothetical protein